MNYWLINPKSDGVGTNTSVLSNKVVYMGWGADDCPKFYNEVQPGDIIIICEKAHRNNVCHFVGIAEKLDKEAQCWHLQYSTKNWNQEISNCIRNAPSDFAGGNSSNPWGQTKSIICLGDNPAEMRIKQIVRNLIEEMEVTKIQEWLYRNHNIILHGAPGTGKTHKARRIAEVMNCSKEQMGFVQFHPSYDYTDFVEGLRPIKKGENVGFERKDGVFKAFCKKALKAYNEADDKAKAPKYVFVIDEINRGDMSKIFGELFFSIDPGYRGEDGRVDTQYQNLIEDGDVFKDGFYVPENVYIIGTMNDIDRSVESMDFAMRRRFAFMEITAEESQSMLTLEAFRKVNNVNADKAYAEVDELKKRMNALNEEIISTQIGLSTDYQIGAAYFLKFAFYADQDKQQAYKSLWDNHLKSVITEYLRGTGDESSKFDKLKAAYDNGKTQNNG